MGQPTHFASKDNEDKSMSEKPYPVRGVERQGYGKTRVAWPKLDCLKPNRDGHSKAHSYSVYQE